jgi:membrane-associated phospholipid phosphatase
MEDPGARLLPVSWRPGATALVALAVAVIAVLGARYSGQSEPGRLDAALDTRVAVRLGGHARLLDHLVLLGNPYTVIAVSLVLANLFLLLRPGRAVGLALIGPGLGGGLTELVLKPLVGRTKGGGLAFPSGHTTGAFCVALVAGLALLKSGSHGLPRFPLVVRLGLVAGGLALAGGTATAMVALRAHYATDVVGGVAVALLAVVGTALVLDGWGDRQARRRRSVGRVHEQQGGGPRPSGVPGQVTHAEHDREADGNRPGRGFGEQHREPAGAGREGHGGQRR